MVLSGMKRIRLRVFFIWIWVREVRSEVLIMWVRFMKVEWVGVIS